MSEYKTIEGRATAEIVEKKSRFIAHLCHVEDEQQALDFLAKIRSEHAQARHNVYAYILKGGRTRYSDDGEPAQTSGLPTFKVLEHAGLADAICVTTRYFGGTLLGTGGLVRAYTQAAQAALDVASIVSVQECIDMTIELDYQTYSIVERLLRNKGVDIRDTAFTDVVVVVARCAAENAPSLRDELIEVAQGRPAIELSEPFEGIV